MLIMENFDDYENESYQPATEIKYSIADHLRFILNLVTTYVTVMIYLVLDVVLGIVNMVTGGSKKSIAGQVALVTGTEVLTV